jgi:GTPase
MFTLCVGKLTAFSGGTSFARRSLRNLARTSPNKLPRPSPPVDLPPVEEAPKERRLDIVILGRPNAGKSTLLNQMIKTKLAASSRKRNTTRTELMGVFNYANTQLAFYDTPGFVDKGERLKNDQNRELSMIAASATAKADVVLLVVDAARCKKLAYREAFAEMVSVGLVNAKKELILVLNKVDQINPKSELLDITRMLVSLINGIKLGPENEHKAQLDTTTFMVSALENDGLVDIKNYLISIAENRPWTLGSRDGISGVSTEARVEEMVREKLLDLTHEEIPYIADVKCDSIYNLNRDGSRVQVNVSIWVDTPSQKRIIVGHGGHTALRIRQSAVADLEIILNKQVILMIDVRIRKERTYARESEEDSYA